MSKRTLNKTCPHCHCQVVVHYRMEEVVVAWGTDWVWPDVRTFVCPNCQRPLYPKSGPHEREKPEWLTKPINLCTVCRSVTRVAETVEGGGDVIERHVCQTCGKESYLGRFSFRPSVPTSDCSGSKGKHFCVSCNFGTDCEQCPCCGKTLR